MNKQQTSSRKTLKSIISPLMLSLSVAACGSGGGVGAFADGSDSGGGDATSGVQVQEVATISSTLNSSYTPTCIYYNGTKVFLINANGSGTGVSLDLATSEVVSASGLPALTSGDKCLANYQQLTWVNESNPLVVNMYDSSNKQTTSADLTASGRSAAEILKSSFGFNPATASVFSNLNFTGTGSLNFTKFMLDNPAGYTLLDNSLYVNRDISNVLYGFNGTEGQFLQLIPTSGSLPAGLLYVQQYSVAPIQHMSTITDANNQVISAMSSAWDFTAAGGGIIVATGLVQPVLFKCPLKSYYAYKCDQSYTSSQLVSRYRITRLLGGNSRYVYFMGLDLGAAAVKIFAIQL